MWHTYARSCGNPSCFCSTISYNSLNPLTLSDKTYRYHLHLAYLLLLHTISSEGYTVLLYSSNDNPLPTLLPIVPLSSPLLNFAQGTWNPSSTQSLSLSSSVSQSPLFCSTTCYKHCWPNQIYCHSLYKYITTLYEPNTLPIIKLSLQEPFLFQRKTTQSTKTQSLIQSMLGSLQNGKASFISHHPTCSCSLSTAPTNNPFLYCNQFSLPFINYQLLFFSPYHPCKPHQRSILIYHSHCSPPYFYIQPSLWFHQKYFPYINHPVNSEAHWAS